jgi:heavy metal sensor kinase
MSWPAPRLAVRARLTLWYTGILLAIVLLIGALGYSLLRRSLIRDLDASLGVVAQVLRDSRYAEDELNSQFEATLRDLLGPEFHGQLFQLRDPQGRPRAPSGQLRGRQLPLSSYARAEASRGRATYETVELTHGESVRMFTMPVIEAGRPVRLIQVGIGLDRVDRALDHYLEMLAVAIPLAIGLAAAGGTLLARSALRPVDEMSRSARRITGEDLRQRIPACGTGDELDHLAGTLNTMLARLEEDFARVQRFTADAAHELRTPLTALKGGLEVALRAERSADEYRRILRSSLEEAERLIRLAEDLLLLSRFSPSGPPPSGRVALEPLVTDVLDVGTKLAESKGVAIQLEATTPATVLGDALALRRALRNLVENAVKYTPSGGKVGLALFRTDGHAEIAVRDTGLGIDPTDAERAFQPFVRLDVARSQDTGGAGLGLAIARSIVVAHGGTLEFESAPGAGSVFKIRLHIV